jgi:hypothetical protein
MHTSVMRCPNSFDHVEDGTAMPLQKRFDRGK